MRTLVTSADSTPTAVTASAPRRVPTDRPEPGAPDSMGSLRRKRDPSPDVGQAEQQGRWRQPWIAANASDAGKDAPSAGQRTTTRDAAPKRAHKKPTVAAPERTPPLPASAAFPIVGIGASAGGLEALERFLAHVPPTSGMAFVIVQHQDPTHNGLMPELLQHATLMTVIQVTDRTRVRPECVYVIPPNKDMSILHGVLHLLEPTARRGLGLPIDLFLRSLAQDQQDRSIGVILSGMGSDGTLGLRAIKEKAGLVLVQEPASAKFDSMPRSAIDAGLADIIAPVDELPAKILAYLRRVPLVAQPEMALDEKTRSALDKAVILLRAHTGHDFSLYKRTTLYRRIERRMGIHQIGETAAYVRYLQENSQELDLLFKELLIGVTSFFRDPGAWEQLRERALPALFASRSAGQALRAWVPGCSTGEEAYSLAMVFKEALEAVTPNASFTLEIFATDLNRDAIDSARQGFFPKNIAADVSPERLTRFFADEEHGYRVRKEVREMVIFAPQNLVMDPPFTKIDILSCRNLLIYVGAELQKSLLPLFHYSLTKGGLLFLGNSETIGTFTDLFSPLSVKARIFQRSDADPRTEPFGLPTAAPARSPGGLETQSAVKPQPSLQCLADQLILRDYAPPAALVNDKGDIFYISGRTGDYLEPAAGKADWNIFSMAREGLRDELATAFQRALRQKERVRVRALTLRTKRKGQAVELTVQRLDNPGALHGLVMIVFTELPAALEAKAGTSSRPPAGSQQLADLALDLRIAREDARTIREEMRSSQDELQSTNQELQSINEEMQSTNEELTTSKEEMQSLNEELQTVNAELQAKVDELARSNNDMKNLLDSTDIATVFLDKGLRVRRFTTQATNIIKLIPGDVGRPLTDLGSDLWYPELTADAAEVLKTLVSSEKPVGIKDGRWFMARIMPYRTLDDKVDGVVMTLTDITDARSRETELRDTQTTLEKRVEEQALEIRKTLIPPPGDSTACVTPALDAVKEATADDR